MKKTFKKNIIILLLALTLLFLCSCGSKKNNKHTIKNSEINYITILYNTHDDGRIFSSGGVARYQSYETMKWTPLCSRPNCTHTTGDCPAKIMGECPMVTDDGVYFFIYSDGVNELSNGKREHYMESKLCRISLDSSEMEEIVSFTDCVPHDYDGMLLYNNKIYFTATDLNPIEDEFGNINVSNVGGNQFFCCIDLETGKYTNYGCLYDFDKLSDDGKNANGSSVKGVYNSKIYIQYQYVDDKDIIDENGINVITNLMYEFDPETTKITASDLPKPMNFLINDGVYIYYDEEKHKIILLENDKKKELDIDWNLNTSLLFNDKIFGMKEWYDLNDMSVHSFSGKYESYWVMDYYDGYYIFVLGNQTIKLTEEELFALDKEN